MTHNQIEYWKLQEEKRSNIANETENARHNKAYESEVSRHNVATETLQLGSLNETIRSNKAREGLTAAANAEIARHNVASENLQAGTLGESIRHNQQMEAMSQGQLQLGQDTLSESQRHNQATELINTGGIAARTVTSPTIATGIGAAAAGASAGSKAVKWKSIPGLFTINLKNTYRPIRTSSGNVSA